MKGSRMNKMKQNLTIKRERNLFDILKIMKTDT